MRWNRGLGPGRLLSAVTVSLIAFSTAFAEPELVASPENVASTVESSPSTAKQEQLAKEFTDPLTTLPQLFVQNAYTPANYGTEAPANRVIARLIVPRIPRLSLFPFPQLVRPSLSLVTVPTGRGKSTRTELGDMQLFDLLVMPGFSRESGFLWGFGPVFVFPTATHKSAGEGAWQVGPALAGIYKKVPGLLLGGLVQNPISFAYTSGDRRPVSKLLIQPIVLLHIWRGLYVKSADATWVVDWHRDSKVFPLSFGLGYVIPRKNAAPINLFVSGEWTAYRENAPVAPQTTVRLGLTVGLPGFSLGATKR